MSQGAHDWLRKSTTFSRLVNPELHAKPNYKVGAIGTGLFVFLVGNLWYERHIYIREQAASAQTPRVEHVMKEDES
ncbi:hypothetical protein M758_1G193400 [Ceratodon purpureus]|nr:hypothetical protein M758_1G193400 [Ceratodon purpureus]